jgi:hypothetical protein
MSKSEMDANAQDQLVQVQSDLAPLDVPISSISIYAPFKPDGATTSSQAILSPSAMLSDDSTEDLETQQEQTNQANPRYAISFSFFVLFISVCSLKPQFCALAHA